MAKTVLLKMSSTIYTPIPADTEFVDTNLMADCVSVIVYSANDIRAQHCLGGVEAAVDDLWGAADQNSTIIFIGGNITDYVRGTCNDSVASHATGATFAVVHSHRALVNIGALARAASADEVAASSEATDGQHQARRPTRHRCTVQ